LALVIIIINNNIISMTTILMDGQTVGDIQRIVIGTKICFNRQVGTAFDE
jgi:hypothetical protein